jgi:transcriptional regulator GlxA family with amidase domain
MDLTNSIIGVILIMANVGTSKKMKPQELCAKAEAYLRQVIGTGKTVRVIDIAHELGITTRNLERAFKAAKRPAPKKWELELRTTEAIGVYVAGDISEKTVAQQFGFADSGHFSRTVKRFLGKSPFKLRRERLHPATTQ